MNTVKFNARQLSILVFLFCIGSSILIAPVSMASVAKQDAWISIIIGTGTGLILINLYIALWYRYSHQNLLQISEQILGKWLGKTVSILLTTFFCILTSLVLRNIGDFMTTAMMPDTPLRAFHLLVLMVVIYTVQLGLEPLARAAEIFFPFVVFLFLILTLFVLPEVDLLNLFPIMAEGIKPVIGGSTVLLGIPYLELITFMTILPAINRPEKALKALHHGLLLGGLFLLMVTQITILVLGPDLTSMVTFPSFLVAEKISIGSFVERIEALLAVIWFMTIFVKMTVSFYATVVSLATVFNLPSYRPFIYPVAMIVFVISLVSYPNIAYFINFTSSWFTYVATFGLLIPLLLLVVSWFRKPNQKDAPPIQE